ncbi:protein of unknown function [Streptococcus thermophilus]|uniref:Uncharacterized protein n=1 Tax=Streptococcus thermophilus TaxID=1308 RepID=A0AAN1ZSN6_STRTR|nr:protein of unknown function [Streptococcus thermophilus]CAD0121172.1 protein of unknown function [Streptococcus thermophilus]CAD0123323.1 protein of unknown function [Streptococcus thermophilus]CAD0125889.1 protein of unknown function [Streptococcus thermophilus]CAD0128272.1 protein of unknown function [Streptococcus thermophilus]
MNDNINNHFSIPKKQYIKGGEHEWVSVLLLPAMVSSLKESTNQAL